MARTWTKEQAEVISHRGGDLTVSAAAGSGKTTVMVERVLRLVREEQVDLQRILLVTFTRAAAGEMRQRIASSLDAALSEDPRDAFLRRQRQALQDAPIGTLHSFCGDLLRTYGAVLGLDPDFSLCDETRRRIFWNAAKEEAIRKAFETHTPGFALLARGWSLYTNDGLGDLCDAVQRAYSASPLGVGWVRDAAERYAEAAEDPYHSPWTEVLVREGQRAFRDAVGKLVRAEGMLDQYGAPENYRPTIEADLEQARRLEGEEDAERLLPLLEAAGFGRIANRKKDADAALAAEIKRLRDEAKKDITDVKEIWEKIFLQRDVMADTARMVPAMFALADLMEDCEKEFSLRKEARSCLDFNDLEHKTLALLEDEDTRQAVSERFLYVFVDEYQDTNAVQEAILMKIARPGTFFCVGDAKQAIYRFRQADPTLFLERYDRSSPDPDAEMRRIDLSSNFRSHPGILRFVNAVFSRTMTKELGGLRYDEAAALVPGLDHPEPEKAAVSVDLLRKPSAAAEDEDLEELSELQAEALRAAWRIRQRMGLPIRDGDAYRPARYRDFVILMERTAYQAETVAEVLRSCGIPCVAQNDADWLSQPETLLLLSALRYLDNSDRSNELMTLLHSPFGGFSLEELLEIRRSYPDTGFTSAVRQAAEKEDGLGQRLRSFLQEWDELRQRASYMDVESLIWEIANRRSWYLILGARPGGQEAQRRVRMLAGQAHSLAQTRERSLFAFLRFVESLSAESAGEAGAAGVGEEDAVWITTIHRSKGLEFPVVILMRAGRGFRKESSGENLLFHDRLGLGPKAILEESHWKTTTLAREAVLSANRQENRSERLRLLYVALTRPREELIIIATMGKNPEKDLARWCREETEWDHAQARSLLDWMGPVFVRHPAFAGQAGMEAQPMDFSMEVVLDPEVRAPEWKRPDSAEGTAQDAETFLEGFRYEYPYQLSVGLPSKIAVTALLEGYSTRRSDEPGDYWPASDAAHDPRRIGTLTHGALRYLHGGMDRQAIRQKLKELEEQGVFSAEDLSLIRMNWLERFCASDLARRMEESSRVLKEKAFNLFVKAEDVYPDMEGCRDLLMIQGVIDMAFLEEGGWVLVDYKTNRMPDEGPQVLLEHYTPQLTMYRKALEEITGLPVRAAGLYLLASGKTLWLEGSR